MSVVYPARLNEAVNIDEFIAQVITKRNGNFVDWELVVNVDVREDVDVDVLREFLGEMGFYLPISFRDVYGRANPEYALILYETGGLPILALSFRNIGGIDRDHLPDLSLWARGEPQRPGVQEHYRRFFDQLYYCAPPTWINRGADILELFTNPQAEVYITQAIAHRRRNLERIAGREFFVFPAPIVIPNILEQPVVWIAFRQRWFFINMDGLTDFNRR